MKEKTIQIILGINAIIFAFALLSCTSEMDHRVTYALELAGENRHELEKVLEHYEADKQKLEAARFLIAYMPGKWGYDTVAVAEFDDVYAKYREITDRYADNGDWYGEVDDMWKEERMRGRSLGAQRQDVQYVTAEFLIREIDLAFKAWQENAYTRTESFDHFCQYILPYRVTNGICLDDSRSVFYQRHAGHYCDTTHDVRSVTDSLHWKYSNIIHSQWAAASLPLYRAKDMEMVRRGLCEQKAWYNSLLTSAQGMSVCQDFVPAWGNRNGSHGWNALVLRGETLPFEPFWENDRWKYKELYSNSLYREKWGKFRLSKVYRHTYEHHVSAPMLDERVDQEDIPPLFRNHLIRDVSASYFDTTNVTIKLAGSKPEDTHYAYLATFSMNREWVPVSYGVIAKNGTVTFKGMGRDVVYLPFFYKKGSIIPADDPFEVTLEGDIKKMRATGVERDVQLRSHLPFGLPSNHDTFLSMLRGGYLLGYNCADALSGVDTLYHFQGMIDRWNNEVEIPQKAIKSYRYVALEVPADSMGLCELTFFRMHKGEREEIPVATVRSDMQSVRSDETIAMLTDGVSATGCKMHVESGKRGRIVFDLGTSQPIEAFRYVPYVEINHFSGNSFELQYWGDGAWHSIAKKENLTKHKLLHFKHVPDGVLYRLRVDRGDKYLGRIFTYENGHTRWF